MAKAKKSEPKISSLERALNFLDLVHNKNDCSMFCNMELGYATAFNLVAGVGTPVHVDLAACPHIGLFQAAIARCGERYAITQLSLQKLLVRSGEFHAYIPCADESSLYSCAPDAKAGILNDRFMEALGKVAPVSSTTGERVVEVSILLNSASVFATNGSIIMEAWHGNDFPSGMVMPKSSFTLLKKAKKRITAFGFSATSITFYFEDESWLFTKIFNDKWPDLTRYLHIEVNPYDVPPQFFEAAKKVSPFGNGRIFVEGNLVSSHPKDVKEEGSGLALTVDGIQHQPRNYNWSDLALIAKHAQKWDENARIDGTYFSGQNIRGIVHHANQNLKPSKEEDIPF